MNSPNTIVGQNLKLLREGFGLTQEVLAQYLGVAREQVAYYESGARSIPTTHLGKLADLFCINEYDFYEEDTEKRKVNIAFAFRADNIAPPDLESIARFKKIVKNYLNMKKAAGHE